MGFRPLQRYQHSESFYQLDWPKSLSPVVGFHGRQPFRLQSFSLSWRFAPHYVLPVCFTRQALMGFTLQSFPLSHSRSAFRLPLPSCRYLPDCLQSAQPPSGLCSVWKSVGRPWCFHQLNSPDTLMGFSSSGFSHSLPWPTFQLASSRLSAPPLPQTVGLFLLWLSFLPGAVSVVAKHRIFSLALLLRVSTNKEFGLSLSRTADPPEVFGLLLPHHPKTTRNRFSPGQSR